MNDNKKKVLTDEELQEVSGGFDYGESMREQFNEIGSYAGSNSGSSATSKSCGIGAGKTSSSCISFSKESCEKKPKCYWSSDGTCRYGVSFQDILTDVLLCRQSSNTSLSRDKLVFFFYLFTNLESETLPTNGFHDRLINYNHLIVQNNKACSQINLQTGSFNAMSEFISSFLLAYNSSRYLKELVDKSFQ